MKSMPKHQMGALFGALSLGLATSVSAQPITAAHLAAGAAPTAATALVSPSAVLSLDLTGGAPPQPTARRARAPISRPPLTAPESPRSLPTVQVEPGRQAELARNSAAAGLNHVTANPVFEMKARSPERRAAARATEPSALVAGATKRAGASILSRIPRLITGNPN